MRPWIHSPLFMSLAVIGAILFGLLGYAGVRADERTDRPGAEDSTGRRPLLSREVPWYWFVVVYVAGIGLLLFIFFRLA